MSQSMKPSEGSGSGLVMVRARVRVGVKDRVMILYEPYSKPQVAEVVDEILVKETAIGTLDEVGPTVIDLLIQAEEGMPLAVLHIAGPMVVGEGSSSLHLLSLCSTDLVEVDCGSRQRDGRGFWVVVLPDDVMKSHQKIECSLVP